MDSAYLSNKEGIITNTEKQILETSGSTYVAEQYYMDRWQCNISYLTTLDWHNYKVQFQQARPGLRIYMIKILTGWLPVKYHINKMSKDISQCHLCNQNETIAHLFQCSHREHWKRQHYKHLTQYLTKLHTPSTLQQNIITHIKNITQQPDEYSNFHHFIIYAGLLPLQWKESLGTHSTFTSTMCDKWMKQLGQWFTTQGHELWISRNNNLHDKEKKHSTMDYILNQKIRRLYSLQEAIGYHDRDLFATPLEDRLNLNNHQKMLWITTTTKTMKVSMEEFQTKQTTGQRDIRQYFTKRSQSH